MKISVIALGKIGLPVAAYYAARGHQVTGCDVNPDVVAAVNAGRSHIEHEPGLPERVAAMTASGRLRATTDIAAGVAGADVVVVLVPLEVDAGRRPDFRPLDRAFQEVSRGLANRSLVVLETTVPVGTTRTRFLPMLESAGRRCGRDFFFAFSPERLQSGRVERDLLTYPRVVGGIDEPSAGRAAAFYAGEFGVSAITLANAEAAELCKLAESIYRDVNIALANELAGYAAARGIDIHEVIPAANSQPQSHLHRPGLGVGGHCIPVYPYFLAGDSESAPLTLASRAVNDAMPYRAAALLDAALDGLSGRRVLILGLTYRPGVRETAHSPALDLASKLAEEGARVFGHDPLLSDRAIDALGLTPLELDAAPPLDAIVLHTNDPAYRRIDLPRFPGLRAVLDAPGAWRPEDVAGAGITYLGIGRPTRTAEGER